jgi:hypothetical protein
MRSAAAAVALLLATTAGGCKKKDEEKKPAAAPAPAPQRHTAGRTGDQPVDGESVVGAIGRRAGADAVRRLRMLPIAVDEVKSIVPVLPDGKALGPPTVAMGGRQVRASQCVSGRTTTQVAADLSAALEKQGFAAVRTKPHPRDPGVVLISGQKAPLRVGGSIQRGDFVDCPQASGGTKVALSYFKRASDSETGETGETSEPEPAP